MIHRFLTKKQNQKFRKNIVQQSKKFQHFLSMNTGIYPCFVVIRWVIMSSYFIMGDKIDSLPQFIGSGPCPRLSSMAEQILLPCTYIYRIKFEENSLQGFPWQLYEVENLHAQCIHHTDVLLKWGVRVPPQTKELCGLLHWQKCVSNPQNGGSLNPRSGCSEMCDFALVGCKPEIIPCRPFLYGINCLL